MRPTYQFFSLVCAVLGLTAVRAAAMGGGAEPLQLLDGRSNRVDYRIEATVEDADRSLSGEEWITWENRSGEPVADLWFHLYLNAFSNNRSTHLSESRGQLRGVELDSGWGWQRVTGIWVQRADQPEIDVFGSLRYEQPDDDNVEDKTVCAVDLPWPIASGEQVAIRVTWESRLPRVRRRTGIKGDFIFSAQWFPKLGVYEAGAEGQAGAWNCHQFHTSTEFYANYGTYDVTLDLPAKYHGKVGGSGVLERSSLEGERSVTRFLAPSLDDRQREDYHGRKPLLHDFAWTADPDYEIFDLTFKFRAWAEEYADEVDKVVLALGRPRDEIIGRNVEVRVLMQPERAKQAQRHFDATCTALFFYGLWWGPYPYEQVTVVDPAWGAGAASGMEYPTLFTCGTRLFTRPSMHTPESVTVHECGHQFWYGLVGNNEFEAAWLDEGFNSYTDSEAIFRRYGESVGTTTYARYPIDGVRLVPPTGSSRPAQIMSGRNLDIPFTDISLSPLSLGGFVDAWRDQPLLTLSPERTDPRWSDRSGYLGDPDRDPVDTCAYCYVDRRSYRTNSYRRPAVALRTLCGLVGNETFLRGMRHYSETWRYRHPYPDDFFAAFIEGSGEDVSWYFEEVFRGTGTVDWAVDVEQRKTTQPKGLFQAEVGGEFTSNEASAADEVGVEFDGGEPAAPESGAAQNEADQAEPGETETGETEAGETEAGETEAGETEAGETEAGEAEAESDDADPEPVEAEQAPGAESSGSPDLPAAEPQASTPEPDSDEQAPEAPSEPASAEPPVAEPRARLPVDESAPDQESTSWDTRVVITRHGSLALPLVWEVVFENGDRERGTWTRAEQLAKRWLEVDTDGSKKVVAVRLDPERLIYLDTDMSNNQWFDEPDRIAPLRWSERVFTQVSQYLHWMSKIGG